MDKIIGVKKQNFEGDKKSAVNFVITKHYPMELSHDLKKLDCDLKKDICGTYIEHTNELFHPAIGRVYA